MRPPGARSSRGRTRCSRGYWHDARASTSLTFRDAAKAFLPVIQAELKNAKSRDQWRMTRKVLVRIDAAQYAVEVGLNRIIA